MNENGLNSFHLFLLGIKRQRMALDRLSRLDLNLLVSLHVLLEYKSVSKAANKLHISQSAMSKTLARLRELFEDPLLERAGYGMKPTLRAQQLQPELVQLLLCVEKITAPNSFDPQTSGRCFTLTILESIYPLVLSKVINTAFSQAPNIDIDIRHWEANTFQKLEKGDIDFAITGKDILQIIQPPKGVIYDTLFQVELCCLVKSEHPALSHTWDLEEYLSYRHIMPKNYENERWFLDVKLAEIDKKREIAIYVPDFNNAAELCNHTDFVLTLPNVYAQHIAEKFNLKTLPLPFSVPELSYTLFCHENRTNDLAHSWLKGLILSHASALSPPHRQY